jgi:hypothetical protein
MAVLPIIAADVKLEECNISETEMEMPVNANKETDLENEIIISEHRKLSDRNNMIAVMSFLNCLEIVSKLQE